MKKLTFPLLNANEIECRVGMSKEGKGVSLLLYKDARCDMARLDEVVGAFGWSREHSIRQNYINGQPTMVNYCKVSIYDEDTEQWVSKEDVGTESNTENAKGEASDAFKRACVNWGIGRELYTAPFIWVNAEGSENLKYVKFYVSEIGYDDNRSINRLTIVDGNNKVRFTMGGKVSSKKKTETKSDFATCADANAIVAMLDAIGGNATTETMSAAYNRACELINGIGSRNEATPIYNAFARYSGLQQSLVSVIQNKLASIAA